MTADPAALRALAARVRNFSDTRNPEDRPIPQATMDAALYLIANLGDLPLPQASPSPDGEIGLYWFHNGNAVESYMDEEGHFTWIMKVSGKFINGGDGDWTGTIPPAFLRDLEALYHDPR